MIIEDITNGVGKLIKKGNVVTFTYTVSTKSSSLKSQPVQMEVTLGNRKNLPCWNIGILGMKVGGVRRIESPPDQAYGTIGIPPFIGGNAIVEFEITVISSK